jgi:hypothetical protein
MFYSAEGSSRLSNSDIFSSSDSLSVTVVVRGKALLTPLTNSLGFRPDRPVIPLTLAYTLRLALAYTMRLTLAYTLKLTLTYTLRLTLGYTLGYTLGLSLAYTRRSR